MTLQSSPNADPISRPQWLAFGAAWLGWAFDGLDGFLYSLVALPFVHELLGKSTPLPHAIKLAAVIQAVFLAGWALGGVIFGRIGDRLGRVRTLNLTIGVYAVFTGLSFFSQTWWHLLIFRFVAALGIGGEWAAGSSLIAEVFPKRHKHSASATLQNGYIIGMIVAAFTVGALGSLDPRYVFLVGVIPAVLTFFIRRTVPESEAWIAERNQSSARESNPQKNRAELPHLTALFRPPVLKNTLMAIGLAGIALTAVWGLLFFSTQVVLSLPKVAHLAPAEKASIVRHVTIIYCLWNIAGNYFAGWLAAKLNYRWAFGILFFGSLLTYVVGFHSVGSLASTQNWMSATMFFGSGVFALFPLYIPPLFPTLLRTTGSGLTYNIGRLTAAVGTLIGGSIAASAGGPHSVIYFLGFLYLPAVGLAFFAPIPGEENPALDPKLATP